MFFIPRLPVGRTADARREVTAHVNGVRAAMGRMDHTFSMARSRNQLRLAIKNMIRCGNTSGTQEAGTEASNRSGAQVQSQRCKKGQT